jgi:RNA polymerase sigma factor (sigma-70 family)
MPAPVPPDLTEGLTLLIERFSDDRLGLRLTPGEVHATAWAAVQAALDRGTAPGDHAVLLGHAERAIRDAIPEKHDGFVWHLVLRSQGQGTNRDGLRRSRDQGRERRRGAHFDDLLQEGRIALLTAARRYCPEHRVNGAPVRFTSYARHWVKLAIRDAHREAKHAIRLPHWVQVRRGQLAREKIALEELTPRQQACVRQADRVRVLCETDAAAMASDGRPIEDGAAVEDTAATVNPQALVSLLARLTPRERDILSRRFGLNANEPVSFQVIARELGYCDSMISKIALDARRKLQVMVRERGLEYDDFTID